MGIPLSIAIVASFAISAKCCPYDYFRADIHIYIHISIANGCRMLYLCKWKQDNRVTLAGGSWVTATTEGLSPASGRNRRTSGLRT